MKNIPTISISGVGYTGCYWEIDGLSYPWDTDQYNYAYVVFNSSLTSPAVYPPVPVGSNYNTPSTLYSSLSSGTTYTAIGYLVTPSGTYATSNSYTFTTLTPRPSSFSFAYSVISSGQDATVDIRDWNNLTANIDSLRIYKGLSAYGFTSASGLSGQGIPAFMFNQLVNGANALSSYMTNNLMPSTTATGNDFYATYLNNIVTSINSIP